MLDGGDGPARLVFKPTSKRRRVARLSRRLAIVRPQPPLGQEAGPNTTRSSRRGRPPTSSKSWTSSPWPA